MQASWLPRLSGGAPSSTTWALVSACLPQCCTAASVCAARLLIWAAACMPDPQCGRPQVAIGAILGAACLVFGGLSFAGWAVGGSSESYSSALAGSGSSAMPLDGLSTDAGLGLSALPRSAQLSELQVRSSAPALGPVATALPQPATAAGAQP